MNLLELQEIALEYEEKAKEFKYKAKSIRETIELLFKKPFGKKIDQVLDWAKSYGKNFKCSDLQVYINSSDSETSLSQDNIRQTIPRLCKKGNLRLVSGGKGRTPGIYQYVSHRS